jgi:hypothetical protein
MWQQTVVIMNCRRRADADAAPTPMPQPTR